MKIVLANYKRLVKNKGDVQDNIAFKKLTVRQIVFQDNGSIMVYMDNGLNALLYPPKKNGDSTTPNKVVEGFNKMETDISEMLSEGLPNAFDVEPNDKALPPEPDPIPETPLTPIK